MAKTRIACAVVGVLSLVAAALLAWWITPSYVARIPSGKNIDRNYEGTFQTLLDPQALASGNLLGAIKQNVPVTVAQAVKVEQTSGNTALVSDSRTTSAAGTKVEQTKWQYAVDRQSLEAVSSHPSSWNVIPAKGLTVSWPFGAQKKDYQGWTPETQTTTPLKYLRSEKKQGITTYVYEAKVSPTKIVDPQILASLPKELPLSLIKLLGTSGILPAGQAGQLGQLLGQLADPVQLAYTFQDDTTFWVDPNTGLVIDVHRNQQRVAAIALPTGNVVPLIPAVAVTYQDTAASSEAAADDARHGHTVISWLGVYLPIILLALGVVLLALAAFLWMRRRPAAPVAAGAGAGPGTGTGTGPEPGTGTGPSTGPGTDPGTGQGPVNTP
jgi:hypothetical protein